MDLAAARRRALALPFILFAIAMPALLGNGLPQAMVAVGVLLAPGFFRVSRAAALSVTSAQYVEAATLLGASAAWQVRTHVWRVGGAGGRGRRGDAPSAVRCWSCRRSRSSASACSRPRPTWGGMLAERPRIPVAAAVRTRRAGARDHASPSAP